MAYIYEIPRKSGTKYRVTWYENGKQVTQTVDTKREANALKKQKEAEVALGIAKKPSDMTFGEYSEEFIKIHTLDLKSTTSGNYNQYIKLLNKKFNNTKIIDMTPSVLDKYFLYLYKERGLKMNTIKKYRDVLKLVLKDAVGKDIIVSNPIDKLAFKFVERNNHPNQLFDTDKIASMNDLKILIDSFQETYYKHFITLGYMTGMRKGEILALKWDNVNFDKRLIVVNENYNKYKEITVTKNAKTRVIYMHENLYYLLQEIKYYQDGMKLFLKNSYIDNNLVVCKKNGEYLNTMTVTKTFYEKNKIYGTNVTPHKLRHTFATLLREAETKDVQALLGHSNIEMTDHYQHHDEFKEDTKEKMDKLFKPF